MQNTPPELVYGHGYFVPSYTCPSTSTFLLAIEH